MHCLLEGLINLLQVVLVRTFNLVLFVISGNDYSRYIVSLFVFAIVILRVCFSVYHLPCWWIQTNICLIRIVEVIISYSTQSQHKQLKKSKKQLTLIQLLCMITFLGHSVCRDVTVDDLVMVWFGCGDVVNCRTGVLVLVDVDDTRWWWINFDLPSYFCPTHLTHRQ